MKEITGIVILPLLAGLLLFMIPDRLRVIKGSVALVITFFAACLAGLIFSSGDQFFSVKEMDELSVLPPQVINGLKDCYLAFRTDNLSKLILLVTASLSFLILLFSVPYSRKTSVKDFFSYFLITTGCASGAVLSDNLLLFLFFWGLLGLTLYRLGGGHDEESSAASKKTLILIGASDSIMIIGIAIVWKLTGTLSMGATHLPTTDALAVIAFLALLTGSFTKAGAFPFHTWVPDYSESAPSSSSAFLPASLDKLLGIYFLARITNYIFVMNEWLTLMLLIAGVTSIIAAVMMALTQHNYRRLLGFHAVSQVGYMILGFGMGSMIGVAAGLFHMVNNAIYKSGLFLCAGCVDYRTSRQDIEDLGGLSKAMPVTFFATLIFALSISGVPPLNGFASKWMIYQAIIEFGKGPAIANQLWVVWLGLAVLGSALTLASFIKLTGGIFLGRQRPEFKDIKEVPVLMWLPVAILALVCIFTGVFATGIIVPDLFMPVSGVFRFAGFWNSSLVSLLVLISILLGTVMYLVSGVRKFRTEDSFIGGEKIQDTTGYPTSEFYKTITGYPVIAWFFRKAGDKWFDIYDLSKRSVLTFSHSLSEAHAGVLTSYIIWVCAALIILLMIML